MSTVASSSRAAQRGVHAASGGQSSASSAQLQQQQQQRPRTIADLTHQAKAEVKWDSNLSVHHWISEAERYHAHASTLEHSSDPDPERIFLELVKATEVLFQLRTHPNYVSTVPESQRKGAEAVSPYRVYRQRKKGLNC